MDMGTLTMGCMNYEINRDAGNLPEHDIEFISILQSYE